ncbi:MAG: hypothetical protein WD049_01845 [Candidatus Paceibacterota bacterium]
MSPSPLQFNRGVSFVEIIIATSIIILIITGIVSAYSFWINEHRVSTDRVVNAMLLEEGVEAVRSIRDRNWSELATLSTSDTHYLSFATTTSTWSITTEPEWIDSSYKRWFEVRDVERDGNDMITESGGTVDPNTKKVTVYATWNNTSGTTTREVSSYFANLFEN